MFEFEMNHDWHNSDFQNVLLDLKAVEAERDRYREALESIKINAKNTAAGTNWPASWKVMLLNIGEWAEAALHGEGAGDG